MSHHKKMADMFLQGQEDEAYQYLQSYQTPFDRLVAYENLLTPSMYHVGELWETNEISVSDEHLATAICDFVLSQIDDLQPSSDSGKKVLLFGVEEEQHYLGLKMVASIFREKGWKVRYLGPNLPLSHAHVQVNSFKPDVIGVSAALSYRLPTLKKVIESLENLDWKPTILIGGRMTKKHDLTSFTSDRVFVMQDLHALQAWLEEDQRNIDATSS